MGQQFNVQAMNKFSNSCKTPEQFPKSVKRFSDKNCDKTQELEQLGCGLSEVRTAQGEIGLGGVLSVDLNALQHNYRLLVARANPAQVAGVVKADAYGIGAAPVARALFAAGCRCFFVAQFVEALRLRPFLPQAARIGVLNDFQPGLAAQLADAGVIPVLNCLESVNEWAALCRQRGQKLPAMLQIDSGMARLGLDAQELAQLTAQPDIFELADILYLISHLACADEKENSYNQIQLDYLRHILTKLPPRPVSFANSGGVFLRHDFAFDMVRAGIALYGVDPHGKGANDKGANGLRPVISLQAYVIQTRRIKALDYVGYGCSYQAKDFMPVATIAVGYGDGWPRALSNIGAAFWRGVRLPIIGHVSMDSITLDISALPEDALKRGDMVELIGSHQTLSSVARDAGTIPYEILTNLGQRYERHYINGWGQ